MDVVDAESLDDCAEGEYKTRRKWTDRAFNKDITDRDGCETLWMTRDSFYLDPMWCAHTGNVRMMCATRKCVVHASSWVFCVHRSVAFSELRLAGRGILKKDNYKSTTTHCPSFLVARVDFRQESMLTHFTIFQINYRHANCADATSANSQSTKTNSTMLSLVTSWKKRMMAVDVRLRSIQPNLCLATQDTLVFQDRVDYSITSCHLLGCMGFPFLFVIALAYSSMQSSLRGALASILKVEPAFFRGHVVEKRYFGIYLSVPAAHHERNQFLRCGPISHKRI